jgi:hypothetical protein
MFGVGCLIWLPSLPWLIYLTHDLPSSFAFKGNTSTLQSPNLLDSR